MCDWLHVMHASPFEVRDLKHRRCAAGTAAFGLSPPSPALASTAVACHLTAVYLTSLPSVSCAAGVGKSAFAPLLIRHLAHKGFCVVYKYKSVYGWLLYKLDFSSPAGLQVDVQADCGGTLAEWKVGVNTRRQFLVSCFGLVLGCALNLTAIAALQILSLLQVLQPSDEYPGQTFTNVTPACNHPLCPVVGPFRHPQAAFGDKFLLIIDGQAPDAQHGGEWRTVVLAPSTPDSWRRFVKGDNPSR